MRPALLLYVVTLSLTLGSWAKASDDVVKDVKAAGKEVGKAVKKGVKELKPRAKKAGQAVKEAAVEVKDAFKN